MAEPSSARVETQPAEVKAPSSTSLSGRFGRYAIERLLGRGGMGAVYLARQTDLDRRVVIKVIAPELAADPVTVARLEREAKAAARIDSDYVVKVLEFGVERSLPYIAMEFVDGISLSDLLKKRGRLPHAEATKLVLDVAKGLAAAHAASILHRDVKPANVLLTKDGRVKVSDFGLARVQKDVAQGAAPPSLTETGAILGTPDYMAPEQADGRPLDARTDIYALGVTYYELLTGTRPFRGATPMNTIMLALTAPVTAPHHMVPEIPADVERACLRLMAREPDGRPRSTKEVVDLLERLARASTTATTQAPGRSTPPDAIDNSGVAAGSRHLESPVSTLPYGAVRDAPSPDALRNSAGTVEQARAPAAREAPGTLVRLLRVTKLEGLSRGAKETRAFFAVVAALAFALPAVLLFRGPFTRFVRSLAFPESEIRALLAKAAAFGPAPDVGSIPYRKGKVLIVRPPKTKGDTGNGIDSSPEIAPPELDPNWFLLNDAVRAERPVEVGTLIVCKQRLVARGPPGIGTDYERTYAYETKLTVYDMTVGLPVGSYPCYSEYVENDRDARPTNVAHFVELMPVK